MMDRAGTIPKHNSEIPRLETNSFYIPYTIEKPDNREFLTSYIDYQYDDNGNCKIIIRAFDADV